MLLKKLLELLEKEKKLDISDKGMLSFFFGRGVQSTAPGLAEGGPAEAGKELSLLVKKGLKCLYQKLMVM
jgi:predicted polyphosphate/ATP-dependent NAD kinase